MIGSWETVGKIHDKRCAAMNFFREVSLKKIVCNLRGQTKIAFLKVKGGSVTTFRPLTSKVWLSVAHFPEASSHGMIFAVCSDFLIKSTPLLPKIIYCTEDLTEF